MVGKLKQDASSRGRRSRRKGASNERRLVRQFREIFPEAKRGLQSQGARQVAVPDVDIPGWWVEAKVGKRPNVLGAWKQAQRDTDGREALIITKWDNGPELATVSLESLLGLLKKIS
jgi:hypothetical protein